MSIFPIETLQQQCLNCIILNFPQLMMFKDSEQGQEYLPYFQLLQKMFSYDILERLSFSYDKERGQRWLEFLINPCLTQLALGTRMSYFQWDILRRAEEVGRNIRKLIMRSRWDDDMMRLLLKQTPNLREITLHNSKSSDIILKSLSKYCPFVSLLNIHASEVTSEGIQYLYTDPDTGNLRLNMYLTSLHVRYTKINVDDVLAVLNNVPNLTVIDCEHFLAALCKGFLLHQLTESQNEMVQYNITHLYRYDFYTGDYFAVQIPGEPDRLYDEREAFAICALLCPRISLLFVKHLETVSSLESCCEFQQLQKVFLYATNVDYTPLIERQGQLLVNLHLVGGCLSVDSLIQCCPNLNKLKLLNVKFIDCPFRPKFAYWAVPNLEKLTLKVRGFTEIHEAYVLYLLNCCTELKDLILVSFKFHNRTFISAVMASACMSSLNRLKFIYSVLPPDLKDGFIRAVPNLSEFIVDSTGLS